MMSAALTNKKLGFIAVLTAFTREHLKESPSCNCRIFSVSLELVLVSSGISPAFDENLKQQSELSILISASVSSRLVLSEQNFYLCRNSTYNFVQPQFECLRVGLSIFLQAYLNYITKQITDVQYFYTCDEFILYLSLQYCLSLVFAMNYHIHQIYYGVQMYF